MELNPEQKQELITALEKIEGRPDAERWREYKNILFKVNPKLQPVDRDFIKDLDAERDAQFNEYGSGNNLRRLMEMPRYLYDTLLLADPELNARIGSPDKGVSQAVWRELATTFPEYRIARKI